MWKVANFTFFYPSLLVCGGIALHIYDSEICSKVPPRLTQQQKCDGCKLNFPNVYLK